MILDCPQCAARFLVADALIPSGGRLVRCGKCTHQWHVTRPENEIPPPPEMFELEAVPIEPPSAPPLSEEPAVAASVPALSPRRIPLKPFVIAAPALAALWLVLAFFTYFPSHIESPLLGRMYKAFGITSTEGLVLSDISMQREAGETKTRFIFAGSIVNHGAQTRTVPSVYVALKDKAGDEIWGRDYPVGVELKPGEVYPFRIVNVETSFADKVTTIVLDLGHPLELMMR